MSKNTKIIIRIFILFIGFVLPFFGVENCPGAGMYSNECIVYSDFLFSYASFYNLLIFLSAFLLLVPIALYCAFVIGATLVAPKIIEKLLKYYFGR